MHPLAKYAQLAAARPRKKPAAYVTSTAYQFTTTSQTFSFTGLAAGNLAILYVQNVDNAPATPSGWNSITEANWGGTGYHVGVFYKLLDSTDISSGSVTGTNLEANGFGVIIGYSGATSAAGRVVADSTATGSTLTVGGFATAGNWVGNVYLIGDRDPSGTAPASTGMTSRMSFGATFFGFSLWDILSPVTYVDNTAVVWTGFPTTFQQHGILLELMA